MVREILSTLSMDLNTLSSKMLFSLVNNKIITKEIININSGKFIYSLVIDAKKMAVIIQLNAKQLGKKSITHISNVLQIFFTIVKDFYCIVIKIAERIYYLIQVNECSKNELFIVTKKFLNTTPLRNSLGIGQLKWDLEDLYFHYLHPEEYKKITKLLDEKLIDRERYIYNFVSLLRHFILEENITAEIYGRPKHIYSIWQKMQKKYLTFHELFDVRAVRVIVECLQDCYTTLGIIHTHFYHLPNEFDDYITNPKANGYQSIHTVILGPNDKTIEIQIRTRQMHKNAELGIAAHWKYKEEIVITEKSGGYENYII